MDRWTGYFIHEICHPIYTDDKVWAQACREALGALVNGMEDVRIERELIRSMRVENAQARLSELLEWVANREPPKGAEPYDPNDMKRLPWTLALIGRVKLNGYSIAEGERAYRALTPLMRKFVDVVLAKLGKAKDTNDVLILAQWIRDQAAKPQAPSNGEGEGAKTNPAKNASRKKIRPARMKAQTRVRASRPSPMAKMTMTLTITDIRRVGSLSLSLTKVKAKAKAKAKRVPKAFRRDQDG